MGTSGLRKRTKVFEEENGRYLANFVQSVMNACGDEMKGATLVLGGDGRYFNGPAAQIILQIAAGNGVKKVIVGQNGFLSTPAASHLIRSRQCYGGFIMTASHNPGGRNGDWGIKFNWSKGQPAPESLSNLIYEETQKVSEVRRFEFERVNLSQLGERDIVPERFTVEVVDPVEDYVQLMKGQFDFNEISHFLRRSDVTMHYDALNAVTGVYAKRIFCKELGADPSCVVNATPMPDFEGVHPDPNLTYAEELVEKMYSDDAPLIGAASDGDGDRNMVLGKKFFVSPGDSLAAIALEGPTCIKGFNGELRGAARSMPTSSAVDKVCQGNNRPVYETPTGWKFFGNLLDAGYINLCGEESFGTGSNHVREKDGLWAILAWLSILAVKNKDVPEGDTDSLVTPERVVRDMWKAYGRAFFCRYDYEGIPGDQADDLMRHIRQVSSETEEGTTLGASQNAEKFQSRGVELRRADEFSYEDPTDGAVTEKQGLRFYFSDSSRVVFRLSGTGSSGATLRIYFERHDSSQKSFNQDAQDALKELINATINFTELPSRIGRDQPTVIT